MGRDETLKICVCCIASTENKYIREWVLHYKSLGVNNIFIYDNNPTNGERFDDVIGDLINEGYVKIINVRGINQWFFQYRVYEDFYRKHGNEYDWICYFDCDEFLMLKEDKTIQDYLSRSCFNGFENIHINWKMFDDNNLVRYEDKPVMERFTRELPYETIVNGEFPENDNIKSIVKGKLNKNIVFKINTHTPSTPLACCNNRGDNVIEFSSHHNKCNHDLAQLNHYYSKTIEEYVTVKMQRGYPDQPMSSALEKMNVDKFFQLNKRTEEKEKYLKNLSETNKVKTYITYFDEKQIGEYGLKFDENTILFKGNDETIEGDNINDLNHFYCELTTMFWVWKNTHDDLLCFKQYRRPFETRLIPNVGEVVTYDKFQSGISVEQWFKQYHGKKRNEDVVKCLIKMFGEESPYVRYWKYCNYMYTNNSMVIHRVDFDKMCEFVFGVLFELDKMWRLNFDWDLYLKNAHKYTEDGRTEYQEHFMAYIGERLVSAYITMNLNVITIPRLEDNGFYKPY